MNPAAAIVLVLCAAGLLRTQSPAREGQDDGIVQSVRAMAAGVSSDSLGHSVRTLSAFETRHTLSDPDPAGRGIGAARAWVEQELRAVAQQSGGRLVVSLQTAKVACARPGMPREVEVTNVLATLRGTVDPDRAYVVSGHYDSRNANGSDASGPAPGANDDASGTAVVLEACRVMARHSFPATIVFAAYDGEEHGLLGSQAHAEALAAAGVRVDGMVTCDIVGNTMGMDGVRRDRHVRCFSYAPTGNDSTGRSLARVVASAAVRHARADDPFAVQLVWRGDRYGRGGDHKSFFDRGFPAVRLTEPREDFSRQHQDVVVKDGRAHGDIADAVDTEYMRRVTMLAVATLAELATAPPAPVVLSAEGARDRYDTKVIVQLPEGATRFELVWRETTAPDWSHVVSMEDAAATKDERGRYVATLRGVCIDDVVVGARTVADGGARSRAAAAPEPDRFQQRRDGVR